MRSKIVLCAFLMLLVLTMAEAALADEQFGVAVYPNATADAGATKFLQESLGVEGFAFRTDDSVAAVVEFYKSQDGIRVLFANDDSAMFKKGDEVDITLQSPWRDMHSGTIMQDCLISIVKRK